MATDLRQQKLLEDTRLRAASDYEALWNIYRCAVEEYGLKEPLVHDFVIQIVVQMLELGYVLGEFIGPQGRFTPWPDQTPSAIMERLGTEWQSPRIPQFDDPWFDLPRADKG